MRQSTAEAIKVRKAEETAEAIKAIGERLGQIEEALRELLDRAAAGGAPDQGTRAAARKERP